MTLTKYKKIRNIKKSGEPKGKLKVKVKKLKIPIFVIHKHHASHLHYDLRLEIDGVLKSWAVPKEPPRTKGIKRLAIAVEDHPLDYATFEGIIPEGNYGAGKVEIWDNGTFELINDSAPNQVGLKEGVLPKSKLGSKIEFKLKGKKMKGIFVLIKTNYGSKPEKSWLWFKI
ncbi:3'-phosphoesterase [Candidatus Pacearchaeota archaeon]|nr:3'-phosphoesterase [Candidatus Pacearchaeota archaeon]